MIKMNKQLKQIAVGAFELREYIDGTESGGIGPAKIITNVTEDEDMVDIEYTYPATCGLSDVRYHVINHGKIFHETYRISNNKLYLMEDGKWTPNVFVCFINYPEINCKIKSFYETYKLAVSA